MKRAILISILSISILSAEPHTSFIDNDSRAFLEKIGIFINSDKVIIDTNKTSHFIKKIKEDMSKSINEAKESIKQEGENIGIHKRGNIIEIDLNQTKKVMQSWINIMKNLDKELNQSIEEGVKR